MKTRAELQQIANEIDAVLKKHDVCLFADHTAVQLAENYDRFRCEAILYVVEPHVEPVCTCDRASFLGRTLMRSTHFIECPSLKDPPMRREIWHVKADD